MNFFNSDNIELKSAAQTFRLQQTEVLSVCMNVYQNNEPHSYEKTRPEHIISHRQYRNALETQNPVVYQIVFASKISLGGN